jgi:predicted transposase YbfD/YdcC
VKDYFDEETLESIRSVKAPGERTKKYKKTIEKEHSAIVTREYYIEPEISWLYGRENWAGLNAIGIEIKKIEKNRKNTEPIYERRCFITSLTDVNDFSRAVRGHWGIENGLHWHLDYTFKDDKNTTTSDNGAEGLQIFKKIALALLKIAQVIYPPRTSLKMIRYRLSLDYEQEIERIFTAMSIDSIRDMLAK